MVSYKDEESLRKFINYQYLEQSQIPTLKFQRSLPRLPIPKLEETIDKYLEALKPIIADENQYKSTVEIAHKFRDNEGKKLHSILLKNDKANKDTSYISEYWFDMYLTSRLPLVINFNPFMAFKNDPDPRYMNLPIRATNMIISALRFRRSLVDNVLSPEVYHMNPEKSDTEAYANIMAVSPDSSATYVSYAMKAYPLDMSQYLSLFGTSRIPMKDKDQLAKYNQSHHIIILKMGQFYSVEVLDNHGNIRSPQQIYTCISYLANLEPESSTSIAVCSTDDRETWADNRQNLLSLSPLNQQSLHLIDSALFAVCFDDISFDPVDELEQTAHNYLHGNSLKQQNSPCNRWFDKSFSFIFDSSGHVALTFEHSWGDGVAVLRLFNDIYKDSTYNRFVTPETELINLDKSLICHIDFDLNNSLIDAILSADRKWRELTTSLDINYGICDNLTREYFKSKKVSPDSMFQLSFQIAYFTLYKTFCSTYESCSTAAFKKGRTEVVRSATNETSSIAREFVKKSLNIHQMRQLLDECSKKHSILTRDAAMGKGFDRHLFALRKIAEKQFTQDNMPQIFTDKSYIDSNYFILSTSSLYGSYFSGAGFGPVVTDGFGIGYGYIDGSLGLLCSSYKSHRDGKQMVKQILQALQDIRNVLDSDSLSSQL